MHLLLFCAVGVALKPSLLLYASVRLGGDHQNQSTTYVQSQHAGYIDSRAVLSTTTASGVDFSSSTYCCRVVVHTSVGFEEGSRVLNAYIATTEIKHLYIKLLAVGSKELGHRADDAETATRRQGELSCGMCWPYTASEVMLSSCLFRAGCPPHSCPISQNLRTVSAALPVRITRMPSGRIVCRGCRRGPSICRVQREPP